MSSNMEIPRGEIDYQIKEVEPGAISPVFADFNGEMYRIILKDTNDSPLLPNTSLYAHIGEDGSRAGLIVDEKRIDDNPNYSHEVQAAFGIGLSSNLLWKQLATINESAANGPLSIVQFMSGEPRIQAFSDQLGAIMNFVRMSLKTKGLASVAKVLTVVDTAEYATLLNSSQYSNRYIQSISRAVKMQTPQLRSVSMDNFEKASGKTLSEMIDNLMNFE